MERIIILIGGVVIFLGMIFSFFNAVTTNPAAFVIVFLLGVGIIAYFFFQGDGVWNPNNDGLPAFQEHSNYIRSLSVNIVGYRQ